MYRNQYGWDPTEEIGPAGEWHYPRPGSDDDNGRNPCGIVRQAPWYLPYDSIGSSTGSYAYNGASIHPAYGQGWQGAGYPDGQSWGLVRPEGAGRYETIPLGVRGMTDNDNYDVSALTMLCLIECLEMLT